MFSNSRGGVPVYLRGQVTGLQSSCSVLHQVQVCCVSGGHTFRLIKLTFITWQDNKTRLLWTKECPSLALYPHLVWSLYPLGKCWPREYTASDMKFWCLAIALMTSPCPCSLVYPAVILSSERKFPLPSVLVVSVKKSKKSISTLAK